MIDLSILAALVIGYGLVSGWLAGTSVTAPMVFVTAGLVLGESGLGWFTGTTDEGAVRILAEATLVLVLFTDAVRIRIVTLRREYQFPARGGSRISRSNCTSSSRTHLGRLASETVVPHGGAGHHTYR